jgi:ABC-type transporter Mla MlaB component
LASPIEPDHRCAGPWHPTLTTLRGSGAHGYRPALDGTTGLAPRLTITCTTVGPCLVLVLRGSLDAESVIALHSQFEQLATGEFDHIVVDTAGLTSIDPAGASALSDLGEHVSVVGAELRLR